MYADIIVIIVVKEVTSPAEIMRVKAADNFWGYDTG